MYSTWLVLAGIFFVISLASQLLARNFRFRSLLLIAAGALLYMGTRTIVDIDKLIFFTKETARFSPLLLGICTILLIAFLPQQQHHYTVKSLDSLLPLLIFFAFYGLYSLLTQNFIVQLYWLLGGIFIVYSSQRYRGTWYAILLSASALLVLSWNTQPSYHGLFAGSAVISIAVLASFLDKKQTNRLLYKQLGFAGLFLCAASKINPIGGSWLLTCIPTPQNDSKNSAAILQTIEDIAFCTLGWLAVPVLVVPGFSFIHVLELFLNAFIMAAALSALVIARNINAIKACAPEIKTIIHTDAVTVLTAGYLVCAGNFPVVLFGIVLMLYIISLALHRQNQTARSTIKPVVIIGSNQENPLVLQCLKLFGSITSPIVLMAEHRIKDKENILAFSMAELITAGYTVIPQSAELASLTTQDTDQSDAIPVLISADKELYTKIPALVKKYYILMPFKPAEPHTALNKITILGSLERPGKSSFDSCAPLVQVLAQNSKTEIVRMLAIGNSGTSGTHKNYETGKKYMYISRNELQNIHKLIPSQSTVLILCDDSPGWPPLDFRIPDIIAETHPCILAFPRTGTTAAVSANQYPEIVETCIHSNRVLTFGTDSAIADAIKALLTEIFRTHPKEADTMASIFYPKAFQEPIMLDSGIMLLHARNKKLTTPELAIALSTHGWQHLAMKQPVHCILMLISPETITAQEHLDNLSALVHAIRDMHLIQNIAGEKLHKQ